MLKLTLKVSVAVALITVSGMAESMSRTHNHQVKYERGLKEASVKNSPIKIGFPKHNHFQEDKEVDLKSRFLNDEECDTIIDKEFIEICYDYDFKAAKSVAYTLEGDLVNETNIKERPSFYEEESLDEDVRASRYDYTNTGFDRGHMAPDAAFDWSEESLESTYSMANIIPQIPYVNREMWTDVEKYARRKAVDLGEVKIINVVKYDEDDAERIGESKIAVSNGFYKVLYNEEEEFEECYYYANKEYDDESKDKLEYHLVDCSEVGYK